VVAVDCGLVAVDCGLVAVDSGASKSHAVRHWLRYHNEHTSSKLCESYIESIGNLLWFEHQKNGSKQRDIL